MRLACETEARAAWQALELRRVAAGTWARADGGSGGARRVLRAVLWAHAWSCGGCGVLRRSDGSRGALRTGALVGRVLLCGGTPGGWWLWCIVGCLTVVSCGRRSDIIVVVVAGRHGVLCDARAQQVPTRP